MFGRGREGEERGVGRRGGGGQAGRIDKLADMRKRDAGSRRRAGHERPSHRIEKGRSCSKAHMRHHPRKSPHFHHQQRMRNTRRNLSS